MTNLNPYGEDLPKTFKKSGTYAFASNSRYIPNPYFGFEIIQKNNKYLNFTKDGARALDENFEKNLFCEIEQKDKIVFLYGGSVMFGSYALSDSKTIGGYLNTYNSNYRIFNFALPGSIIYQNFSHFFNYAYPKISKLGSEVHLVFLFGFNEFQNIFRYSNRRNYPLISLPQLLFGNTVLGRLSSRTKRARYIKHVNKNEDKYQETKLLFQDITIYCDLLKSLGIKIYLLFQPNIYLSKKILIGEENRFKNVEKNSYENFRNIALESLMQKDFFYDLTEIFDEELGELFLDEVHIGSVGNRIIANQISKILGTNI